MSQNLEEWKESQLVKKYCKNCKKKVRITLECGIFEICSICRLDI